MSAAHSTVGRVVSDLKSRAMDRGFTLNGSDDDGWMLFRRAPPVRLPDLDAVEAFLKHSTFSSTATGASIECAEQVRHG